MAAPGGRHLAATSFNSPTPPAHTSDASPDLEGGRGARPLDAPSAIPARSASEASGPRPSSALKKEGYREPPKRSVVRVFELLGGEAGADLISLRDTVLPDGLSSMQKTYRAEAGQALQLADNITPEIKAKAKAIHIGPGPQKQTLLAYLNEWITLGKRLGAGPPSRGRGYGMGTWRVKALTLLTDKRHTMKARCRRT